MDVRRAGLLRQGLAGLLICGAVIFLASGFLPHSNEDFIPSDSDDSCPNYKIQIEFAALPALPQVLPTVHLLGVNAVCEQKTLPAHSVIPIRASRAPPFLS